MHYTTSTYIQYTSIHTVHYTNHTTLAHSTHISHHNAINTIIHHTILQHITTYFTDVTGLVVAEKCSLTSSASKAVRLGTFIIIIFV